ncbi:MAG: hypothetical protein RIR43_1039 [Pseudomonadota bacterium]
MTTMQTDRSLHTSRRGFLLVGAATAGGLLVGCTPMDPRERGQWPAPGRPDQATETAAIALNAWLRIDADGRITVAVPRAEMGQGVHTSLAMLVADELEADWARIGVESPPPDRVYANTAILQAILPFQPGDQGWLARSARAGMAHSAMMLSLNLTGGSTSVRAAWEPMRWAGAAAREMLRATAARAWKVPLEECRAAGGEIAHTGSGRRMHYGEVAQQWQRQPVEPPVNLGLKAPDQWRLIGTSPTRLDTPAKVTGRAAFGSDLSMPGLLRAVLRTCPYQGGRLVKVDSATALRQPGVRAVHEFPDWPVPAVAVVAEHTWQALRAAEALDVSWDPGLTDGISSQAQLRSMRQMLEEESGTRFRDLGDAPAQLAAAPRTVSADYAVPYLAHAVMEPMNATARLASGKLALWSGTQAPTLARWRAAQIADIAMENVQLHIPYLGGGFGRRLETDVVEQATHLALKMPGTPIHLMWTREQDLQHDMYRPAATARLQAAVNTDRGELTALQIKVVRPSLSDGSFRRLFPSELTAHLPAMPDKIQIEGAFDLPYAIAHQRVTQVLCPSILPVGSWRSVGYSHNAFFTECFLDEVAQTLGQDPLEIRLKWLKDKPRHQAVLRSVARAAQWGEPMPTGRARGLALQECFGSICAQVAEVSLRDGRPRVHRIVCALDAGMVVHPDTVRAQLEGAIVFGLSAALWGEVPVQQGRVLLRGWADHPVMQMAGMPIIETVIVPSTEAPGGVGEPGTPPVAPAVVNALARLEPSRRRQLPLMPRSA